MLTHGGGESRVPGAGKCGGAGKAFSFGRGKIIGGGHAPGTGCRVTGKNAAGYGQAAGVKVAVVVKARPGGIKLPQENFRGRGILAVHTRERRTTRAEPVGGKGHDGRVFTDVYVAVYKGRVLRERVAQEEAQRDGQGFGIVTGLGEEAEEGRCCLQSIAGYRKIQHAYGGAEFVTEHANGGPEVAACFRVLGFGERDSRDAGGGAEGEAGERFAGVEGVRVSEVRGGKGGERVAAGWQRRGDAGELSEERAGGDGR